MPEAPIPPSLPHKIVVSLKVGAIFFALANIICVAIVTRAWLSIRLEPKTLAVTGSAKKAITSDLVRWSGTINARDPELIKAYDGIKQSADKVKAYLLEHGIPESAITLSSINTIKHYVHRFGSPPTNQVISTEKISEYDLTQSVTVDSPDMEKVSAIARSITELIKDGVEIDSGSPSYLYTKLSELKINMLADATKDATSRAEQIVNNANGQLGKLVEAHMGVMQINPKGSSEVSATGVNDTTSRDKEITAVVTAQFEIK